MVCAPWNCKGLVLGIAPYDRWSYYRRFCYIFRILRTLHCSGPHLFRSVGNYLCGSILYNNQEFKRPSENFLKTKPFSFSQDGIIICWKVGESLTH